MYYELKKPNIVLNGSDIFYKKILPDKHKLAAFLLLAKSVSDSDYLYWTEFQYKQMPEGLTKEECWFAVKYLRTLRFQETPIKDCVSKNKFSWYKMDFLDKFLHELDMDMGGSLHVSPSGIDPKNRNTFISRGVMEEAIASSQLEGAHTTRKAAKKMILENRKPVNESERMILNNYRTMLLLENDYKNRELSKDLLLELHAKVTEGTIGKDEQGRFREDTDDIVVKDKMEGLIYHVPPKNDFLLGEIENLIDFANDNDNTDFIHPVIKGICIHFWFAYLHPFTDGNGRMARLLFYWYLLKNNYWAFSYLPISSVIKKSPQQYGMSYVHTEQDGLDLTYFINYNLKKIEQSIIDFKKYVSEKIKENKIMSGLAHNNYDLNKRQIQLLQFFHENPTEFTTMTMHMNSQQITKMTAIKDLKGLLKKNFLSEKSQGRYSYYFPTDKVLELFKN